MNKISYGVCAEERIPVGLVSQQMLRKHLLCANTDLGTEGTAADKIVPWN